MAQYTLMAEWTCASCDRVLVIEQVTGTNCQELGAQVIATARSAGWQIPTSSFYTTLCVSCRGGPFTDGCGMEHSPATNPECIMLPRKPLRLVTEGEES